MFINSVAGVAPFAAVNGCEFRSLHNPQEKQTTFEHTINHIAIAPGGMLGLANPLKGVIFYVLQGSASVWVDETSFDIGEREIYYIQPQAESIIENTCEKALCILQIYAKENREARESGEEKSEVLHVDDGCIFEKEEGYFLRDQVHPEYKTNIKVPFCIGDTVVRPSHEMKWKKWKISVCEVVTKGTGILYTERE